MDLDRVGELSVGEVRAVENKKSEIAGDRVQHLEIDWEGLVYTLDEVDEKVANLLCHPKSMC
jgi:hypothetical protein